MKALFDNRGYDEEGREIANCLTCGSNGVAVYEHVCDTKKANLRQALIKAYIEEQECKYKSSTSDGPLGIGCDPHAEIMHTYITPFLDNYELYVKADNTTPMTEEVEDVIMAFEEQSWEIMMKAEKKLRQEMVDLLKKQLKSINLM